MIVTMDPELRVYANGALFIKADKIHAIGSSSHILNQFSADADEVIDLHDRILLPGFVNTHVHTSQQLARGIADDVDLMTWLHHRIWPYESQMTEDDSYISTLLCGIELIHSGIQEELYKNLHGTADGRIRVWFGLRQILNATDDLLFLTKEIADKLNTGIHMHVAEIPYENEYVVSTRAVNHGTVTYLDEIGLLGENLLAAHSVWINDKEIELFSKAGVKVSHCPAAAMRMLGFAPIKEMLDVGICVSLGTDGAPSNNRMSIVDEMYLASLINKGREAYRKGSTDPTVLPAETILKMATINGAKAVLWDKEIGSLEVGKKADLVVIDPLLWSTIPLHDPISNLVYCMRTENVESVMCNGQWIMRNRKILTVNEKEILSTSRKIASELLLRANIEIPKRMKML